MKAAPVALSDSMKEEAKKKRREVKLCSRTCISFCLSTTTEEKKNVCTHIGFTSPVVGGSLSFFLLKPRTCHLGTLCLAYEVVDPRAPASLFRDHENDFFFTALACFQQMFFFFLDYMFQAKVLCLRSEKPLSSKYGASSFAFTSKKERTY